ncbi:MULTISPECIES: phosphatase PAP2 family protein [unclassified Knoellia]|uniref:phosphatase PAP2 family protein n=1 Tax=Knoellia altitudinis TaxID=3404795 RepID=UPI00360C4ABF
MDPTVDDVRPTTDAASDRGTTASQRPGWAQLLIALSPLSPILVAYAFAQWASAPLSRGTLDEGQVNRLGAGLQIIWPAAADRRVFGEVPSVWLQDLLLRPEPQWYDVLASLVYVTHYVALPVLTAGVWFMARSRFAAWITAVLVMTLASIAVYVIFPASPPWLAAELQVIESVQRASADGWAGLDLEQVGTALESLQGDSNPVAAMPSLHAAVPALMALFLWPRGQWWVRALSGAYAAVMAWTLVYTGEHYVVDVVAGWSGAAVAVVVARGLSRRREARDRAPTRAAPTSPSSHPV